METTKVFFNKPSLVLRIKSMVIDSFVIVVLMYLVFVILNTLNIESGKIRGICLGLIFLYEPIMVSMSRTIGQKIMGLRVRNINKFIDTNNKSNINFIYSMVRYISKLILGIVSLFTIHSDDYGQAIHDKISSSVMIIE